jgi:hypothetical protein
MAQNRSDKLISSGRFRRPASRTLSGQMSDLVRAGFK